MKNLKHIFTISILALVLVFSFTACEGPQGPPGFDGNANVFSINYAIFEEDWQEVGKLGENGFYLAVDLDVPEINADIVNSGLVLAYYRANDNDPWVALPFTRISHDPEFVETFDFIYDVSFVGLQSMASDRGATPYAGTVRVVVADGFPVGKMSLDTQDYEAVADFLDISESQQLYRLSK